MNPLVRTEQFRELMQKYDVFGPRYTSYPTALSFNDEFNLADYKKHAIKSNEQLVPKPLSLYLHIPFCHSLCYYCGCNKVITNRAEAVDEYLECLYREIELHSELYEDDRLVEQIHFGGGTPTYLKPEQLKEVMQVIAQHFHLGLPSNLEIGIEIDPRSVNAQDIRDIVEMGFNRISVGVQDFDPDVQKAVNRIQSKEQVMAVIDTARQEGIKSTSIDVIYGLPRQTRESFTRTLDNIISIKPERIALYNYAHMPQRINAQKLIVTDEIPKVDEKLGIFSDSINRLTDAGYVYIGMDHFALPEDSLARSLKDGTLQRNFQGYSTHAECDIIGFGVSAISRVDDGYCQNVRKLSQYKAALDEGIIPIDHGISLNADDRIRADVIQTIMCSGILKFDEINDRHEIDFKDYFATEIQALTSVINDKFIIFDDEKLEVTQMGRLFLRNIAMTFDAYLNTPDIAGGTRPKFSKVL